MVQSLNAPHPDDVVFSFGMGWDSVRLWQLIRDDCKAVLGIPLERVTVLTSQTGGEFEDTKILNETHILPEMRDLGVRLVQVARAGEFERDGIVVLDDTRSPTELHIQGAYSLYDEMIGNGTVPQYAGRGHQCAIKYKGWVIGQWIKAWRGEMPYTSIIGYNADEPKRVAKASQYNTHALKQRFPLVELGEGRDLVESNVMIEYGEWKKSACTFCPFTGGRQVLVDRHRLYPADCAKALLLEYVSMALNPRMSLYSDERSLYGTICSSIQADEEQTQMPSPLRNALAIFESELASTTWALYRVRRVYHPEAIRTDRDLKAICTGGRADMERLLSQLGPVEQTDLHQRVYLRRRPGKERPAVEEFFVVAPHKARDKAKKQFTANWARATWDKPVADPLERVFPRRSNEHYVPRFTSADQLVLSAA